MSLNDHIFHPMIYYNPAVKAKLPFSAFESDIFDQKTYFLEVLFRFVPDQVPTKSIPARFRGDHGHESQFYIMLQALVARPSWAGPRGS